MYFADEIRPTAEIAPAESKIDSHELEMAAQLIDSYAGRFSPEQYHDTYRDTLCEIIEEKREGREVHRGHPRQEEATVDLMAALRESVARVRGRQKGRVPPRANLDELSKEELYDRARAADIPGRSKMSKEDLIEALR